MNKLIHSQSTKLLVVILLAVWGVGLCFADVSWAFRPGLFPILDELGNRAPFLDTSYHGVVHLFPTWFYNDRPVGWILIRLLADLFGFDYAKQAACFIAIHVANCIMGFVLFRKLGVGVVVSIAGIALFGSLWTTASTVTYIGAAFDVTCLFFLLASVLAFLWDRRGATVLSSICFLAALRAKEFAIFIPFLLTLLAALQLPRMPLRRTLEVLARKLWLHYLILIVFGLRYASLYRSYRASIAANNPYAMDLHLSTLLKSLSYYTALIFGADELHWQLPPALLGLALLAIFGWAIRRRRAGIAFAACAFVLALQPVCLLPNQRSPLYAYAPQLFLILMLCLLVEEALAVLAKREQNRWIAAVCVALVCLSWCVAFRRRPYFRDRVNWTLGLRRTSLRTARQVDAQLPRMGPGTHVYAMHTPGTLPWVFLPPCAYLRLLNRQRTVDCFVNQPAEQLRASYAADPGPKYLLDYYDNGSFTVVSSKR